MPGTEDTAVNNTHTHTLVLSEFQDYWLRLEALTQNGSLKFVSSAKILSRKWKY